MKEQIEALIRELRETAANQYEALCLIPEVVTEEMQEVRSNTIIGAALRITFADRLTAILAANAGGWRPIEECARGKEMLLFAFTDVGPDGSILNWKMATGHRCFSTGEWVWDGRRLAPYDFEPTHCRPLPEPPPQEPPR